MYIVNHQFSSIYPSSKPFFFFNVLHSAIMKTEHRFSIVRDRKPNTYRPKSHQPFAKIKYSFLQKFRFFLQVNGLDHSSHVHERTKSTFSTNTNERTKLRFLYERKNERTSGHVRWFVRSFVGLFVRLFVDFSSTLM